MLSWDMRDHEYPFPGTNAQDGPQEGRNEAKRNPLLASGFLQAELRPGLPHSKSFHWIVNPSVNESQFGTLSVRTGPAPLEISWNEIVPLGGAAAGM